MSTQMSLVDFISVTSSQESEVGPSPCASQASLTTSQSGQDHVPASRSPQPVPNAAPLTSAISGLSGADLLTSADLQSSLESRLRHRLAGSGSPLYGLKWKHWDMRSGPPICALRARGHRTSAKGSGSEPRPGQTPKACDGSKEDCTLPAIWRRIEKQKQMGLAMEGRLAGWPTPRLAGMGESPDRWKKRAVQVACRPRSHGKPGISLDTLAMMSGWPTATGPARLTADGRLLTGSSAEMPSGGRLSPEHSRWLMGYPPEWASSAPTETPSSLKRRQRSSKNSSMKSK